MKRLILGVVLAFVFGSVGTAAAVAASAQEVAEARDNQRSQVFTVANMTCALCPVTVRKAMARVKGVTSVSIDLATRTATVSFDPMVTSVDAIANASTAAGYPTRPAG